MAHQQREATLLLVGAAKNADEDDRGMQVAGDVHVVDSDQAGLADLELAADGFAYFAF